MSFDPESFIDSAVTGANDTVVAQCPEGTYRAQVGDKMDPPRKVETKRGPAYIFRLNWDILDDTVRAQLERPNVYVSQDLWLDFDETGALDMGKGKNVELGRIREAVGVNDPNVPFKMRDLTGRMATISVAHRADKDNPERKYAEVRRVAPQA